LTFSGEGRGFKCGFLPVDQLDQEEFPEEVWVIENGRTGQAGPKKRNGLIGKN